jgi:hypothetical protein
LTSARINKIKMDHNVAALTGSVKTSSNCMIYGAVIQELTSNEHIGATNFGITINTEMRLFHKFQFLRPFNARATLKCALTSGTDFRLLKDKISQKTTLNRKNKPCANNSEIPMTTTIQGDNR